MVLCSSEPAPPRSLYAVNATHSSVTLLWTEEGVVDYYQVLCKPNKARKELKVREDVVSVSSAVGSERVQSVPQLQIRKRNREKRCFCVENCDECSQLRCSETTSPSTVLKWSICGSQNFVSTPRWVINSFFKSANHRVIFRKRK